MKGFHVRHRAAIALQPAGKPELKLVDSPDAPQQVVDVRRGGIESCDAAAAVGLDPHKSPLQLWIEKTGRHGSASETDALDECGPLYWQRLLETLLAAHYTRRTGNRLRRVNTVVQHPFEPWMLAQVTWEVVGNSQVQLLECRAPGLQHASMWRDGLPRHVHLQVLHKLAVTGQRAADLAVLLGGEEFSVYRIERDDKLISHLVAMERSFWELVTGEVAPPADGSKSAGEALNRLLSA
jgi:putative phage-type endonuclease